MAPVKLVLFDVDGTLIHTGGAGRRSLELAFEELFGLKRAFEGIPLTGRLDSAIIKDGLRRHGLNASLGLVKERYLHHLRREILRPAPGKGVLPGVRRLLAALWAKQGVTVGLLTGNFLEGARIKLEHFDLWRWFRVGAFAEDGCTREELLERLLQRVEPAKEVWVVGDTPADVRCAKRHGAKSVAVATGAYSREELARLKPDLVLEDLRGEGLLRAL